MQKNVVAIYISKVIAGLLKNSLNLGKNIS